MICSESTTCSGKYPLSAACPRWPSFEIWISKIRESKDDQACISKIWRDPNSTNRTKMGYFEMTRTLKKRKNLNLHLRTYLLHNYRISTLTSCHILCYLKRFFGIYCISRKLPSMKMACSVEDTFFTIPSACHGSIEPFGNTICNKCFTVRVVKQSPSDRLR